LVTGVASRMFSGHGRISQVPVRPLVSVPCSPTPAGPSPLHNGTLMLSALRIPRRLPQAVSFRGSITRLVHSLCNASQPGLPLDHATLGTGWSLAFAGLCNQSWDAMRGFCLRYLPPLPGLSWRTFRGIAGDAVCGGSHGGRLRDRVLRLLRHPWDRWSGRPGCRHPGLPQIRTCGSPASGSSDGGLRCCCVDAVHDAWPGQRVPA